MEYIKTTDIHIELLMGIRLKMLREVNGLSDDYEYTEELVSNSRRYFLEGDQTSIIVMDNNTAIACASMSYYEVMPTFSHPTGKRAHLMNVYTAKEYRRRGIAKKLVEMLINDARENHATEISLDSTDSGRALYKSLGFIESDECMIMRLD